MNNKGSVTQLLEDARQGDETSLNRLFNRFYARLKKWAGRELDPAKCREFDADDIAIEAFHSFCKGILHGKFPKLGDRHSLQALLATITIRKAINKIDYANAQKRGEGRVRGESIFESTNDSVENNQGFESVKSEGLSPAEKVILDDQIEYYLGVLPENLKPTTQRLLLGFSPREIASEFKRSTRAIEIQRKRIFEILNNVEELH